MKNKTIFITGISKGIGRSCAIKALEQGYNVLGCSRNIYDKLDGVTYFNCDVTKENDIKNMVKSINNVDILISCAGYGISGSIENISNEEAKKQFDTNYFGTLNIIREFLPLLRKNSSSKIIIIGSIAGRISIPYQSHYSSTKFALEALNEALKIELKPFNIDTCIVEPGDIKTEFTNNRKEIEPIDSIYKPYYDKAIKKMISDELNGKGPDIIAKQVLKLCKKNKLPVRKAVGIDYKLLMFLKRLLSDKMANYIIYKMYS